MQATSAHALPAPQRERPQHRPHLRSLSPHVLLVANANASGLVRRPGLVDEAAAALRAAGARVEPWLTRTTDELADLLASDERRVVLLGGDGSLHAAANAPGAKPELALLPAGKANNVARSLGVPVDLAAAAGLAVTGFARPLDLIAARTATRRYLAVEGVSVGFHALARAGYHGRNSADLVAGLKAGVRTLSGFEPIVVGVEVDDTFRVLRIGQLFAVNTPFFGPGLHVAPGTNTADGRLELVTLETAGRRELLALVPRLRRGTHLGRPGVTRITTSRVRLATGGRSPIIADTTNLGSGTVELTVEPGALSVVGAQS